MQQKSREFRRCHFEFRKFNIPSLPKALLMPIYFSTNKTLCKLRYSNHQRSFETLKTDTGLLKQVRWMKKFEQKPVITLEIVRKCSPYNPNSRRCYLCLNEKLEIAANQGNNSIKKKTELISKSRHQNKYTLSKYDTKDWRQLHCKKPLYCNFRKLRLLIIFGWRLLGIHQDETLSTKSILY